MSEAGLDQRLSDTEPPRRILILGATGMLGFALHRILHDSAFEVVGTCRSAHPPEHAACSGLIYAAGIDVVELGPLLSLLETVCPDVIVNAVGLKRASGEAELLALFKTNAELPKRLAQLTAQRGIRLVHFSTDAVFDGLTGGETEQSLPSPQGPYALSKYLGEPSATGVLTIRTSMIGRSLTRGDGLIDWLLAQRGQTVTGYAHSIFSGLPVDEIGRFMATRVLAKPDIPQGVLHLSAAPIDKHELLRLLIAEWGLHDITLERQAGPNVNRTLTSLRSADFNHYSAPAWPTLLRNTQTFYTTLGLA